MDETCSAIAGDVLSGEDGVFRGGGVEGMVICCCKEIGARDESVPCYVEILQALC